MNNSKLKRFSEKLKVLLKKRKTKIVALFLKKKNALAKRKRARLELDIPPSKLHSFLLWITEALLAGLGLNFMLWQLAGLPITIWKVLAWSVAYYFFTAEIPQFFVNCRRGVAK